MPCVLRVSGADFDPDAFLATSAWEADNIYRRGEKRSAKRTNETSGFTVLVGPDESKFPEQVENAIDFLQANRDELARLRRASGLEDVTLDFGVILDGSLAASFFPLPLPLLTECARSKVELELSTYAV